MPLVLGFVALLGGVILLASGITEASFADVIQGRARVPADGSSSPSSTAAPATGDASTLPPGTFAPGVTTAGLQPKVIAALAYAKANGWGGQVISAVRTFAQQASLFDSLHGVHPVAPAGDSEHESGGAVDVTEPDRFAQIMATAPAAIRLISGASFGDSNHFSVNGH